MHILQLEAVDPADLRRLGGKAAGLARMVQAGLPVPAAFVISAGAFTEFLESRGAGATLAAALAPAANEDQRARHLVELARQLSEAPVPEALDAQIRAAYLALGGGPVAVRSSATDEDAGDASFAGQYDTFLNVRGADQVVASVRRCWASLCSWRSHVYRGRGGSVDPHPAMAVVVQRMVPARAAGVLFTADPMSGHPDHLLIESCWGLGEGIVSGHSTSDAFVVAREPLAIVERNVRYKLHQCRAEEAGGVTTSVIAAEQRERPSLSDQEVLALARLAVRVRALLGAEQDIEWAVADGQPALLQARAIARAAVAPGPINLDPEESDPNIVDHTMWSMMDAGEATVGIMTPFSQGFMKYYRDVLHPLCLRATGIWDVGNTRPGLAFLHGRCYLNVSHWASAFTQAPPFSDPTPMLRRFCSEEVNFASYRTPYPSGSKGLDRLWRGLYWASQQWRLVTYRRAQRLATRRRQQTFDEMVGRDLTRLSRVDLYREIKRREAVLVEASINYFPFYFLAFGSYEALSQLCRSWLEGTGVEQKLKAEISELRTIDVTMDLWEVARKARANPVVARVVREVPPARVKEALQTSEEGRRFWAEVVEPLLRKHGVRGQPPEMEFMNPRWVDDPSLLFSMARSYLENDLDIEGKLRHAERERDEVTRSTLGQLTPLRRLAARFAVAAYHRFGETREVNRMWAMTETWALQRLVLEVGRRMVEHGVLRDLDELAYIDFRDVVAYAAGAKTAADFPRQLIEANRRAHLFNRRVADPPLTIVGRYDPGKRATRPRPGTSLAGIGTSPGRATGKARVIMDVTAQAAEFRSGEILVAHFTNATWTPLFVTASAVVVDLGSVLAHSSVVAREYGIPCVANTLEATRMVKTGDTLTVDGDTGQVWIESGRVPPPSAVASA